MSDKREDLSQNSLSPLVSCLQHLSQTLLVRLFLGVCLRINYICLIFSLLLFPNSRYLNAYPSDRTA